MTVEHTVTFGLLTLSGSKHVVERIEFMLVCMQLLKHMHDSRATNFMTAR